MPGSKDNVYDLKDYLEKEKIDYFLLVADSIDKKILKNSKKLKSLVIAPEVFTNLKTKTDNKVLLSILVQLIGNTAGFKNSVRSKKVNTNLSLIAAQKFNYLFIAFNRDAAAKRKAINGIKDMSLNIEDQMSSEILDGAMANAVQEIMEHFNIELG